MCQCRIRDKLNNTSIFYFFCISLGGEIYLHFFKKRKKKSYLLLQPLNCKVSSCRFRQILTLLVTDGRIQLCWNWDYVSLVIDREKDFMPHYAGQTAIC